MKPQKILGLLIVVNLLTILTSCDPCNNINCLNGGICDDGTCTCPAGFAGPSCEANLVLFNNYGATGFNSCIPGYSTSFSIEVGANEALLVYSCTNSITGITVEKNLSGTFVGNAITFNTINPIDTTEVWITAGTAEGINPTYIEGVYFYKNANYSVNYKKGSLMGTCSGTLLAAGG